jgi:hypothetical protein
VPGGAQTWRVGRDPTYALAKYLNGLLGPLVGQSDHHIRKSEAFVKKLQTIKLQETDILVSFDVVSLFTKVPLEDTIQLFTAKFSKQTVELFRHVLTTTYFFYDGSFYDQKYGVAMGSPLAPVIADFYMEHFEQMAISTAIKKPTRWYRYVGDIFAVWPHGKDDLQDFLHLNNIHKSIQFTMETEQDRTLPFLDVLVSRRLDGTLGHMVYRKTTHTDLYLHAKSEHHPAHKRAVLTTLIRRAKTLCDPDSLEKEIQHLRDIFQRNGYSKSEIKRALHPKPKNNKPAGTAVLPYQQAVSNGNSCTTIPTGRVQ